MSKSFCIYCLLFLLVLTTLFNPHNAEAGRTVRVGIYEAGALANFDKDGFAHGFFVDMLNHIAEKEQWNLQYVPGSWMEGLDRLKSDNIDLVLCIGYTAEREKYMDFPKEYLLLNWGVLYKPKGSQITSLLELEGKSVSALKGDVYLTGFKELLRQFNVNVKIQEVDQYSKVFKAVESGSVTAGVAGNLYGLLNENGRRAEQTPIIFAPIKVGYAVNEGKNGDLIAALDRNITEMKANKASIYNRELEHLLGKKAHFIPKELYWALSGVAAALLLAIAFIVLLKRQVRSKTSHLVIEIDERKRAEEALLALKDELHVQNKELQMNEEELRAQNDQLLATDEMLRVQINEYEASQKMLRESDEKYRTLANEQQIILNSSPIGISLTKNRKVVWSNPAHCMLFGYEVGAAHNMDTAEHYVDKESYEYVGEKGYATIASGGIFSDDVMMKKKDGSLIWCHLVGQAVTPDNMEAGTIWSILDMTGTKQAEAEHQKLEHQFHQAQKLESLGVLAGGIAHDFNNILTIILAHCYLAEEDLIPEQEYKNTFKQIQTAGNRAADLCRQMLTYAGKSPRTQSRVNLWLLIDEVVKMLQSAIKKNVTIELDLRRDIPEIQGDTGQIQQIIMNLIINSADAIGEANGIIRVVLTKAVFEEDHTAQDTFGAVIKSGRYVCLEVDDTGCGMDEETQKRIFEPFFTTKLTGRGLGMSAIHGIVKAHEGILQMTSTPGIGTTFKVFFPVRKVSDNEETTSTTGSLTEKTVGTILLVEDEEMLCVLVETMLDAMGFSVMTASNGSEALEIYRERGGGIDLILLDLIMPVMGGIEAYHELRNISRTVPIIICSGYGVESVEDIIKNDTYAGFAHKPYNPNELRDVLVGMIRTNQVPFCLDLTA
jgi:PAS domain S-box-containing protein